MKTLKLIGFLFFYSAGIFGQTDNTFWFAPPSISTIHGAPDGHGMPVFMHFTAIHATTVTISRPADPNFTPIEFDLADGESKSLNMVTDMPDITDITELECSALAGVEKKGFLITASPGDITCFYELNNDYNRDIFALKGKNALGKEFTVTTQNYFPNGYSDSRSGFVIVATKNNTTVNVNLTTEYYDYTNATAPLSPGVYSITLNKGETFHYRAYNTGYLEHVTGVKVVSDKPVAITIYDDSMARHSTGGTCLDTFGDQYIPDSITGQEYIVMKGQLATREEYIFITAIDNNTNVYIDGVLKKTLNANEVWGYEITNRLTYVELSRHGYVNQVTGTGYGCEQGGAVLPPIDGCNGSYDVSFVRSGPASDMFCLNIIVRNDTMDGSPTKNQSVHNFKMKVNGIEYPVPSSFFNFSPDSSVAYLIDDTDPSGNHGPIYHWFYDKIPSSNPPTVVNIWNTVSKFHLGVLNGGGTNGGKYGYFSDYGKNIPDAGIGGAHYFAQGSSCTYNPIRLVATGGNKYFWTCISDTNMNKNISDRYIADPYFYPDTNELPIEQYDFSVVIEGECITNTILITVYVAEGPVSDFTISDTIGCSPFKPTFINLTDTNRAGYMVWVFGPDDTEVNQSELPKTFTRGFINKTDTPQVIHIKLASAINEFQWCLNTLDKHIEVLPEVNAGIEVTDSSGCNEFPVVFQNLSTGHIDSNSFAWDFGDGHQSYEFEPSYTYTNYSGHDTIFNAGLKVASPLGCQDSANIDIHVYPQAVAKFTPIDTAGCAPLFLPIKNSSTGGTILFNWDYGDGIVNSNPLPGFTKKYNNFSDKDTTFKIRLIASTPVGCSDTMETNVTVFAEVRANFTMPVYDSCSPFLPRITNLSTPGAKYTGWYYHRKSETDINYVGYKPDYAPFTNKNTALDSVDIILIAYQETDSAHQQCFDTHSVSIAVYPELDAGFSLDKTADCQPFISSVTNTSNITSASIFRWYLDNVYYDHGVTPSNLNIPNESPNEASYTLWMYGGTNFGCRDTASQVITVHSRVYAEFNAIPSGICSGDSVLLDRKGSAGGLTSYHWNFNNEEYSSRTDTTFNHTFENLTGTVPLTKFITLTVANNFGCDSSMTQNIIVDPKVMAAFDPDFAQVCYPHNTVFQNNSKNALTYSWDFGDGTSSSQTSPSHKYKNLSNTSDKTFDIKFIAKSGYHCVDSITKQVTIFAKPYANFDFPIPVDCPPFEAYMADSSIGTGLSYSWDFAGDGNSSGQNPAFTFENTGSNILDKPITLIITSDKNCKDTLVKELRVYPEVIADFVAEPDSGASPLEVEFMNLSENATSYYWLFGSDSTSEEEGPKVVFMADTIKIYPVVLIAKNEFCTDSTRKFVYVYNKDNPTYIPTLSSEEECQVFVDRSNQLIINYKIVDSNAPFIYSVHDITGKLIFFKKENNLPAGSYTESVDLSGVAPGILIVSARLNGKLSVSKLGYY